MEDQEESVNQSQDPSTQTKRMTDEEFKAFMFSLPMRSWEAIKPDITRSARKRYEGYDDHWLRAVYGKGWRGKSRRQIINRIVKRVVSGCHVSWSKDVSAGRVVRI